MKRSAIVLAVVTFAACASAPKQPAVPEVPTQPLRYSSEAGQSPVGVIPAATLHDAQRNRDLTLNIEYPTRGAGPFPLIIFSHAYGGASSGYEGLAAYWTSYGYIVARPSHADAGALRDVMRDRTEQGGVRRDRTANRQEQREEHERMASAAQSAEANWLNQGATQFRDRVRDVTLILDSLDQLERSYPELQGKIDRAKIGVAGHSYGAFTALLAAGAKTPVDPSIGSLDPRVRAVVAMSPQGLRGASGFTAESWRGVNVPVMFMTGSRDLGLEGQTPEWRRAAFENSPAGDKYFVVINGARHMTFAGAINQINETQMSGRDFPDNPIGTPRSPYDPPDTTSMQPSSGERGISGGDRNTFSSIRMAALTFWDAYLKDDAKAKDALKSDVQLFRNTTLTRK